MRWQIVAVLACAAGCVKSSPVMFCSTGGGAAFPNRSSERTGWYFAHNMGEWVAGQHATVKLGLGGHWRSLPLDAGTALSFDTGIVVTSVMPRIRWLSFDATAGLGLHRLADQFTAGPVIGAGIHWLLVRDIADVSVRWVYAPVLDDKFLVSDLNATLVGVSFVYEF